jgi:hypothetical protein
VVRRIAASSLLVLMPATVLVVRAVHRSHPAIEVSPSRGHSGTTFVVRFRVPDTKARAKRHYVLSLAGPGGRSRCLAGADVPLPLARAGARVTTVLDPRRLGRPWCAGAFSGRIDEIGEPTCAHGRACPRYVRLLGTAGRFSFSVVAAGADVTPPAFAGIETATACTPGAQRPGQTTPFTLTWAPATDNVTPTAKIVYDVYESGTAGGEDFSRPSWTTAPGVTSFQTPGLPSHGTFYFVVRARDEAGNEDGNTVERLGSDPCL